MNTLNQSDFPVLFELIKQEADEIIKNASEEELSVLSAAGVKNTVNGYVYGQMTGHCNSERALELIEKCCTRVYDHTENPYLLLNGSPVGKKRIGSYNQIKFFSPIEAMLLYIDRSQAYNLLMTENISNLIKYLKGETKELILTTEGMYLNPTP